MKKNIAIFASGNGTNAKEIIHYFAGSALIQVTYVVSDKAKAGVTEIAREADIPVLIIGKQDMAEPDLLIGQLEEKKVDWIVLAGFLRKIPIALIRRYPNRIINIHPALLPLYGGKGMYGHHVHEAVISAGEKESGITIHYINEHYDEGEIILQKKCPVLPEDDASILAQKVQQLEHKWFPLAIEKAILEETEN